MALLTAVCSLSSSTTTNSMLIEVWKRISSSACRLVGSATARNSRLPRFINGNTRCFCRSLSLTARTASMSAATASRSRSGTPNSFEAEMAISRAVARFAVHQMGHQIDALFLRFGDGVLHGRLRPAARLARAAGQGRPSAMRLVLPTAAIALSFMDLSQTPGPAAASTIE